jgi:ABC-type thiamine transport system ATPase subunit
VFQQLIAMQRPARVAVTDEVGFAISDAHAPVAVRGGERQRSVTSRTNRTSSFLRTKLFCINEIAFF